MGIIVKDGELYSSVGSGGSAITGVKGNLEEEYRKGDVNLTPENIGAVNSDGSGLMGTLQTPKGTECSSATLSETDEVLYIGDIINLYGMFPGEENFTTLYRSPTVIGLSVDGFLQPAYLYISFQNTKEYNDERVQISCYYDGPDELLPYLKCRDYWQAGDFIFWLDLDAYREGYKKSIRYVNAFLLSSSNPNLVGGMQWKMEGWSRSDFDTETPGTDVYFTPIIDYENFVKKNADNILMGSLVMGQLTDTNSPTVMWQDSLRKIWAGIRNGKGTWYLWDSTNNKSIITSDALGYHSFNGDALNNIVYKAITPNNVDNVTISGSAGREMGLGKASDSTGVINFSIATDMALQLSCNNSTLQARVKIGNTQWSNWVKLANWTWG